MCVIMIVQEDDKRPSKRMVDLAWNRNGHGAGIAWVEKNKKGKNLVHWKKNLDEKEVGEMINDLPVPYVVHFRLASATLPVIPEMTHPVPISLDAPLDLEGTTDGYVLFQNGTWKEFREEIRLTSRITGAKIPRGVWSDTRAFAWMSAIHGLGFMETFPEQRGVAFGPDDMEIYLGPGWKLINDIWCSNDLFWYNYTWKMCQYGKCNRTDHLDDRGYCPDHKGGVEVKGGSTEVSQTTLVPFRGDDTQGPILSLAKAEELHEQKMTNGERKISHRLIKAIRQHYKDLNGKDQTKVANARQKLMLATKMLRLNGRLS